MSQLPPTQLRFMTCGSVDDGKSTLIGRLLYESRQLPDDHVAALERHGMDFATLLDGLLAEREQGITIDVAYRFFATATRKFVVADAPGHEQYTRNMVTAASIVDAAVILVDARTGVLPQTRRHSELVALLGVRTVALAVNKLDLVGYSRAVFDTVAAEYSTLAAALGITSVTCIPVSALHGSNVVGRGAETPWYDGPSLLGWLESVAVRDDDPAGPFRMVVQWVSRPSADFRGFAGRVVGGSARPGDRVVVLPGGRPATVARIVTFDGPLAVAVAGQSVTVVLEEDLDVGRGAILAAASSGCGVGSEFEAQVIWMAAEDLVPGRPYLAKIGARTVGVTVSRSLRHNEIGAAVVRFDAPVAYEPYAVNRDLGGFLIIDRLTNDTAGAGLLDRARPAHLRWQNFSVTKEMRATLGGHRGCVVWFTGLSGAGKSTVANLVEQRLNRTGHRTYLLDGDNVRHGLNSDLGFTDADRVENIRRVAETAKLFVDAGLIVLVSFISPFRSERRMARELVEAGEFIEVFVDTPIEVCMQRDPKGLYQKAKAGQIKNFTGIDSPYEAPEHPELTIKTEEADPAQHAAAIVAYLKEAGYV